MSEVLCTFVRGGWQIPVSGSSKIKPVPNSRITNNASFSSGLLSLALPDSQIISNSWIFFWYMDRNTSNSGRSFLFGWGLFCFVRTQAKIAFGTWKQMCRAGCFTDQGNLTKSILSAEGWLPKWPNWQFVRKKTGNLFRGDV